VLKVLGGLDRDTPVDEAKTRLRQAMPLLLDLSPTEEADIEAWLLANSPLDKRWLGALRKELRAARAQARQTTAAPAPDTPPDVEALRREAGPLLTCPDVLAEVSEAAQQLGLSGQDRELRLLYLALTSRIFDRPVSVAVKGASAGGKSITLATALRFFPPSAYYALTAMSERALAYSQEPLAHRFLILFEGAGLGGDFSQYLVRSLLSKGRIRFETVEKTAAGLVPKLIEREGPTGLIITTTRHDLHPENETRLLSLEVDDSAEQTRAVLLAQAGAEAAEPPDLGPFHALQKLLEAERPEVSIRYAKDIALGCDPSAVRLRRDFRHVLTLIKAHAALHGHQRDRNSEGRIMADWRDYEAVFGLAADIIARGHGVRVDPGVRRFVHQVAALKDPDGVTVKEVARAVGIHHNRAWRLAQRALKDEYLLNLETRRGFPAKLVPGEAVPPDAVVLPHPLKIINDALAANPANVQTVG
jgi:hypothetical protein